MGAMTAEEWRELGEAIVVRTGWGVNPYPDFDLGRFKRHFGEEAAARLLPLADAMEEEFYKCEAWRRAELSPGEQMLVAEREFAEKFPDMPDEAVRALGWCYAYDHK
jgi:hypothetical protein